MRRTRRIAALIVGCLAVVALAYTGYVGFEGSRLLVESSGTNHDCRTPGMEPYGWAYEAINYDIADDEKLAQNADTWKCTYEGTKAGTEVVTEDGVRIAGWYIPAGNGAGPTAPTVILVHGFDSNKSGMLLFAEPLHQSFNLVAFDTRAVGRSTGDTITGGVKEQNDLRAIVDWVVTTKHPTHLGALGLSLGAVVILAEMGDDSRIEAAVLDSMHTRFRNQVEARVASKAFSYFGTTWAVLLAARIRTGVDVESVDAEKTIRRLTDQRVLLIHGEADREDPVARTKAMFDEAVARGTDIDLRICPDSGHATKRGMPINVCPDAYAGWTSSFFSNALST